MVAYFLRIGRILRVNLPAARRAVLPGLMILT